MDNYCVVFEFHRKTYGGYTGARFPMYYKNREEYLKESASKGYRISRPIARGVSKEKRIDLLALSPEICQLTRIIETIDSTTESGTLRLRFVDQELNLAKGNIEDRRERRKERHLVPKVGFPFVDTKPCIGYPVRQILFKYIEDNFFTPNGDIIDLEGALTKLRSFIIETYKNHGLNILE